MPGVVVPVYNELYIVFVTYTTDIHVLSIPTYTEEFTIYKN